MPSSVIKSYRYLPGMQRLLITFVSGITYQYFDVTQKEFDEFKTAFSKGSFFNHSIKPFHRFEKLTDG